VLGWWTFWLGVATVVWGVLLPSLPKLLKAVVGGFSGRPFPIPVGFTSAILEFALAVSAIVVGVVALKKGERSWLTLLAFIPAATVGGFWILFALGEVLSPH
jgi:hypothetical protein